MILLFEMVCFLGAYLLGAIPFGYILTKKYTGQNILELGSGNIGSTNVGRIAGKKIAAFVQILDMLKGLLPVLFVLLLMKNHLLAFHKYVIYLVAFSSIVGHNFSIFLHFKGGKGVNTTLGASVLLAPVEVFSSVLVHFLVKWQFKFVSAGSIAMGITMPILSWWIHGINELFFYLLFCSLMIILRHLPNIKRLKSGQEKL